MPLWGPFFKLLMLTCQRRNEVAGIQYHEIEKEEWTIPGTRTKNGKTHLVHLSGPALSIIEQKPVFISRNVSGFSKAKLSLDRLSGVGAQYGSPWRVHDLRRTGATTLQKLGVLPEVIELILNHTPKGIRGVYQRFSYAQERKEALGLLGLYLESL
jgi:integrase